MTKQNARRVPPTCLAPIALTLVSGSISAARAQTYSVTEIPPLPGHDNMHGIWMNDAGQVVGRSFQSGQGLTAFRAVRYTPGAGLTDISPPGTARSVASLINSPGQAIVVSYEGEPAQRIYRYTPGMGTVDLGIPAIVASTGWVTGINDSGSFAGGFFILGGEQRPFLYTDPAGWKLGGQIDPMLESHGRIEAINNAGQVAGTASTGFPLSFGYVFTPGQGLANIGYLWKEFPVTFGVDLNASGAVTGFSAVASTGDMVLHAVLYTAGGGLQDIHTLAEPTDSQALYMNDQGDATGFLIGGGSVSGAFAYRAGSGMTNIAPGKSTPAGINNNGQIIGSTTGFQDPWVWDPQTGLTFLTDILNPTHNPDVVVHVQAINNANQILALVDHIGATVRTVVLTPETGCYPDCNTDGGLTVADFGCFQTRFVAADPYADCTQDGSLTVADFGCFQTKFVGGCP